VLLIGIEGTVLRENEARWIAHPGVAGVVLFRRNHVEPAQLDELVRQIRSASASPRVIAVDQEGGRVQRFVDGFTRLPALARLGAGWGDAPEGCLRLAEQHARLMVAELRANDIDLSFAPVVDLGRGNRAIGDRAFAAEVEAVCALTRVYVQTMQAAGMPATLKHFPGHGSVLEDTHHDAALDPRPLEALLAADLQPFIAGIEAGSAAVMAAHVRYPAVCEQPAGYSRRWLADILRGRLGFGGVIFSDDIGMAAAQAAGGVQSRVHAHLDAGCDLVLACHPELVDAAIEAVESHTPTPAAVRFVGSLPRPSASFDPEALAQARANLAALV
jgi:beta-N-acetylhexosaminidase